MQPRLASGGGGKSNDDIVFELAGSILEKVVEKLDIDEANQDIFDLDSMGRVNSLTTVLTQEVDRFNNLLRTIKVGFMSLVFTRYLTDTATCSELLKICLYHCVLGIYEVVDKS